MPPEEAGKAAAPVYPSLRMTETQLVTPDPPTLNVTPISGRVRARRGPDGLPDELLVDQGMHGDAGGADGMALSPSGRRRG